MAAGFQTANFDAPPQATAIARFYAAMAPFWHPVLRLEDLPARAPVGVRLLGRDLVLARLDGEVVALRDVCRHFQARLSLGQIVDIDGRQCLRCPYHGWSYDGAGRCRRIPQLAPDRAIPASAAVERYAVAEALGLYWVCLEGPPAHALPAYPEFDDAAFRTVTLDEAEPTRASAPRLILATLDDTHFPWVHEGILGSQGEPQAPDHRVERNADCLQVDYATSQPRTRVSADVSRGGADAADAVRLTYANAVSMPGTIRLVKESEAGRYVIWLATSPRDFDTTVNFWAFSRNYDLDPAADAAYVALAERVRAQDRPIIESQRPVLVPPLSAGVSLAMSPADLPLIAYLRWLEELGIAVNS